MKVSQIFLAIFVMVPQITFAREESFFERCLRHLTEPVAETAPPVQTAPATLPSLTPPGAPEMTQELRQLLEENEWKMSIEDLGSQRYWRIESAGATTAIPALGILFQGDNVRDARLLVAESNRIESLVAEFAAYLNEGFFPTLQFRVTHLPNLHRMEIRADGIPDRQRRLVTQKLLVHLARKLEFSVDAPAATIE